MAATEVPEAKNLPFSETGAGRQREAELEEPRLYCTIPALAVETLSLLMASAEREEEHLWHHKPMVNRGYLGTFVLPIEGQPKGVRVLCTNGRCLIELKVEQAKASVPLKVYFPPAMIAAATTQTRTLIDSNGYPFEVEVQPMPSIVVCDAGFGMVGIEQAEAWQKAVYPGILGQWHNGDYPGVKMHGTYRCEAADPRIVAAIEHVLKSAKEAEALPLHSGLFLNVGGMEPLIHAARHYPPAQWVNVVFIDTGRGEKGEVLVTRSVNQEMTGLFMASRLPFEETPSQ